MVEGKERKAKWKLIFKNFSQYFSTKYLTSYVSQTVSRLQLRKDYNLLYLFWSVKERGRGGRLELIERNKSDVNSVLPKI